MWTRSYTIVTRKVTAEQMWRLFADVDSWHQWDEGIEYARLTGRFAQGNFITLKPKDAPAVKVELLETTINKGFLNVTRFPLAMMYDRHSFEETAEGLKITDTIFVKGVLSFLWVKLVAKKMANSLPVEMQKQIEAAANL